MKMSFLPMSSLVLIGSMMWAHADIIQTRVAVVPPENCPTIQSIQTVNPKGNLEVYRRSSTGEAVYTVEPRRGKHTQLKVTFSRNLTDADAISARVDSDVAVLAKRGDTLNSVIFENGDGFTGFLQIGSSNDCISDIRLLFLWGDVNSDHVVTAADVSEVASKVGQLTNTTNFKYDVNNSGKIDGTDRLIVQKRIGQSLFVR